MFPLTLEGLDGAIRELRRAAHAFTRIRPHVGSGFERTGT